MQKINKAGAEQYLDGRCFDDIEIKEGLTLSDVLTEYEEMLTADERKRFNFYPKLFGIVRSMGFNSVSLYILSTYRKKKNANEIGKALDGMSNTTVLTHLKRMGYKGIGKRGGWKFGYYLPKTLKKLMPIVNDLGFDNIDDFIINAREKNKTYEQIGKDLGMSRWWVAPHVNRLTGGVNND